MGIKKEEFFVADCDGCKTEFSYISDYDYSVHRSESEVKEHLGYSDWMEVDGKVLCSECYDKQRGEG